MSMSLCFVFIKYYIVFFKSMEQIPRLTVSSATLGMTLLGMTLLGMTARQIRRQARDPAALSERKIVVSDV